MIKYSNIGLFTNPCEVCNGTGRSNDPSIDYECNYCLYSGRCPSCQKSLPMNTEFLEEFYDGTTGCPSCSWRIGVVDFGKH